MPCRSRATYRTKDRKVAHTTEHCNYTQLPRTAAHHNTVGSHRRWTQHPESCSHLTTGLTNVTGQCAHTCENALSYQRHATAIAHTSLATAAVSADSASRARCCLVWHTQPHRHTHTQRHTQARHTRPAPPIPAAPPFGHNCCPHRTRVFLRALCSKPTVNGIDCGQSTNRYHEPTAGTHRSLTSLAISSAMAGLNAAQTSGRAPRHLMEKSYVGSASTTRAVSNNP